MQRQEAAQARENLYQDICNANIEKDQKLFYKLVNKQRNSKTNCTDRIIVNGKNFEEYDNIIDGWQQHFESLAQPKEKPTFDEMYKAEVNFDVNDIESICLEQRQPVDPVTNKEVKSAILDLKNNKAADYMELSAEHLKMAEEELTPFITDIVNEIFNLSEVPSILKKGHLTQILKKRKRENHTGQL